MQQVLGIFSTQSQPRFCHVTLGDTGHSRRLGCIRDLTLEQIQNFSESDGCSTGGLVFPLPQRCVLYPPSPQYASMRGLLTEALSSVVGGSDVCSEVGWSDSSHLDHYSCRSPEKERPTWLYLHV